MKNVNVEGAVAIARACKEVGVPRLIHVGSMRASLSEAISELSRTKAVGELRVQETFPYATIVRPATISGNRRPYSQNAAGESDTVLKGHMAAYANNSTNRR